MLRSKPEVHDDNEEVEAYLWSGRKDRSRILVGFLFFLGLNSYKQITRHSECTNEN